MSARIDWRGMLTVALSQLGLKPAEFWELTPYEFMLLSGCSFEGAAGLSRGGLNALMAQFPDKNLETE